MNRRRRWRGLPFLLACFLLGSAQIPEVPAARALQHAPAPPIYARLLTMSPYYGSSADGDSRLTIASGDWVATGVPFDCPNCSFSIGHLVLHNLITDRRIIVHTSGWLPNQGGMAYGPGYIHFAAPYLIWGQSAPPDDRSHYTFVPGDFICTICYYDVTTGQGGSANGLLSLDPTGQGHVLPIAMDPVVPGRILVFIYGDSTGTFWVADLRSGAAQPIGAVAPAFNMPPEANVLTGDLAAWVQILPGGQRGLFYKRLGEAGVHQAPDYIQGSPASNGTDLFWFEVGPDVVGLERLDVTTGQQQTISPNSDSDFAVSGARLVYISFDEGGQAPRAVVMDLASGQPILAVSVADLTGSGNSFPNRLSLSGDALLLTADMEDGTLGTYLAWLTPPDPAFARVWAQADAPLAAGQTNGTWLWGPHPLYRGWEPNAQSPGGKRLVEYFDKSRMEINDPGTNPNDPYYVSNGLLATELIAGEIQVGDTQVIPARVPCNIPVAGDPREANPVTPGYAALAGVASLHGEHQAPNRTGQPITATIDVNGSVGTDPARGSLAVYANYRPETGHNMAAVFWSYASGLQLTYGLDWQTVLGYPITEAYWTQMRVAGQDHAVLIQAFQRRVLTYAPDFPPVWQVQQGNVGQHYFEWRYVQNAGLAP